VKAPVLREYRGLAGSAYRRRQFSRLQKGQGTPT
jgi:hypothetical protein